MLFLHQIGSGSKDSRTRQVGSVPLDSEQLMSCEIANKATFPASPVPANSTSHGLSCMLHSRCRDMVKLLVSSQVGPVVCGAPPVCPEVACQNNIMPSGNYPMRHGRSELSTERTE